ncbi:hypothetical protein DQ04_09101010 [Trypanosoma grayi]|uniref:hypothetical protein n=1 Tax=Trypanosoma grayi TaxID=71804 RepID=UPI0004F4B62C|nr:hypothetical protein DQ04_09101010 [Trypanosoma grayi]KEG07682.1 hypothetical protein DQ04_09101010 [Trypanosoma grayi]
MSWPSWVLNEANRQLQHRIDRDADELRKKTAETVSQREVVALLRKNLAQVKRHVESRERAAAEAQEQLRSEDDDAQALQREEAHRRAELHTLQRRHEELSGLVSSSASVLQAKANALKQEQAAAEALEEAALELSGIQASRKNTQETQKEVERQRLRVERVQESLAKMHATLRSAQTVLQLEQEDHAQVQRELAALRRDIERGRQDRAESSLTVAHLQQAIMACEAQTATNAEAYASGALAVKAQRDLLQQLQLKRNELRTQLQVDTKRLDSRTRQQSNLTAQLHAASADAHRLDDDTAALRRQLAAQCDVKRQLKLSCDNACALRDERYARLQQLLLRSRELAELMREAQMDDNVARSTRHLEGMRASLLHNLQYLDGRCERVQAATVTCLSSLLQEGRTSEELNNSITKVRKMLAAVERDSVTQRQTRERHQDHLNALEARLQAMQQRLEQARGAAREWQQHELAIMEDKVQELQAQLRQATQQGFFLRREITPLQCALNAQQRLLDGAKGGLTALKEAAAHRGAELQGLEAEGASLSEEKQVALLRHSEAAFQLRASRQVAESHVDLLRGAASLEDIIRGQALVAEEALLADMRNAVVELHLVRKAHTGKQAELRRCQGQLQLLKCRYQSVMESMGRSLAAAGGSDKDEPLVTSSSSTTPEALHARCILHSSMTREQLRERGNQLDARIVFLERETRTLRKTFQALRAGGGGCGVAAATAAAGPLVQSAVGQEALLLREGVEGSRRAVHAEVCRMEEVIRTLQARRQDLTHRHKDAIRRLGELRALKTSRESAVRRLRAQLKRTQQSGGKRLQQFGMRGH